MEKITSLVLAGQRLFGLTDLGRVVCHMPNTRGWFELEAPPMRSEPDPKGNPGQDALNSFRAGDCLPPAKADSLDKVDIGLRFDRWCQDEAKDMGLACDDVIEGVRRHITPDAGPAVQPIPPGPPTCFSCAAPLMPEEDAICDACQRKAKPVKPKPAPGRNEAIRTISARLHDRNIEMTWPDAEAAAALAYDLAVTAKTPTLVPACWRYRFLNTKDRDHTPWTHVSREPDVAAPNGWEVEVQALYRAVPSEPAVPKAVAQAGTPAEPFTPSKAPDGKGWIAER